MVQHRGARPSVVVVAHTAILAGAEIALARVAPHLDGIEIRVVVGESGPLVDRLEAVGIEVDVIPMAAAARGVHRHQLVGWRGVVGGFGALVASWRLAASLRRDRPAVVVAWSLKAAMVSILPTKLLRIPLIWTQHDHLDQFPPNARRLIRWVLVPAATGVVANSASAAASLGRTEGVIVVNPPGLAVPPRPDRSQEAGEGQPLHVVMVGRIAEWKGQHVAIQAFARAAERDDRLARAELRIVGAPLFGESEYAEHLVSLVADLGIGDRVSWVGQVPDPTGELVRADVLVHASIEPEAWGLVVLEGMQCGLAVVASDTGGPGELITEGVSGLLVPPGDVDALAEALVVLADPDRRSELGTAASAATATRTPAVAAAQLVDAFGELAGWRSGTEPMAGIS